MRTLAWFIVYSGFLYSASIHVAAMFVEVDRLRVVTASIEYGASFIVLMLLKPEWFKKGD
jgi:hypothetical protein